jgi:hypothetical protein
LRSTGPQEMLRNRNPGRREVLGARRPPGATPQHTHGALVPETASTPLSLFAIVRPANRLARHLGLLRSPYRQNHRERLPPQLVGTLWVQPPRRWITRRCTRPRNLARWSAMQRSSQPSIGAEQHCYGTVGRACCAKAKANRRGLERQRMSGERYDHQCIEYWEQPPRTLDPSHEVLAGAEPAMAVKSFTWSRVLVEAGRGCRAATATARRGLPLPMGTRAVVRPSLRRDSCELALPAPRT